MLKRVTWRLRANCQAEHGQLCPPSGIPPPEVLDGTARKAHSVQGQCTVFVSSLSATLCKAGIFAGPLRLALGACVSLPTITRPLPYAWMSGCLLMYNRWLCSPSGLPAPLGSKLSSWLLAPAQSWPGNYQLLLVMTWSMMKKCFTPSSISLTKLKYPVLKKKQTKTPQNTKSAGLQYLNKALQAELMQSPCPEQWGKLQVGTCVCTSLWAQQPGPGHVGLRTSCKMGKPGLLRTEARCWD